MTIPTKTPRFLDLYHAGQVTANEIDDYIEVWHTGHAYVQLHVYLGLTWAEYRTWLSDHWLPTAAEHAAEHADAIWLGLDDEQGHLLRVHPPRCCRPPCPIHWPSDHPLAGEPMWWDTDRGVLARLCRHQIPHPDPDDQQVRLHPELVEHDCDGCCTARVIDADFEEDEPLGDVLRAFDSGRRRGITRGPR